MTPEEVIEERKRTHGDYTRVAVAVETALVLLPMPLAEPRHTTYMILTKLARASCGDADVREHWLDIAGYAMLQAERCTK